MWIRTQDKKQLINISSISITRNYGGRNRFALIAMIINQSKVVGFYRSEFDALQELDNIQKHLDNGKTEVYQVS